MFDVCSRPRAPGPVLVACGGEIFVHIGFERALSFPRCLCQDQRLLPIRRICRTGGPPAAGRAGGGPPQTADSTSYIFHPSFSVYFSDVKTAVDAEAAQTQCLLTQPTIYGRAHGVGRHWLSDIRANSSSTMSEPTSICQYMSFATKDLETPRVIDSPHGIMQEHCLVDQVQSKHCMLVGTSYWILYTARL